MSKPEVSPRLEARVAGVLYLLNIVLGVTALTLIGRHMQTLGDRVNFIAAIDYTIVTALLWHLFLPASKWLWSITAIFSLLGCWLPTAVYSAAHLNNLASFGVYCGMIAYLIARSRFFPRPLALTMACAGLCWLTTIWHSLFQALSPYALIVGVLSETALMGYLVIKGLDEPRWREQAVLAKRGRVPNRGDTLRTVE
jgi:Domain of unknown function (DUF4386)